MLLSISTTSGSTPIRNRRQFYGRGDAKRCIFAILLETLPTIVIY